MVELGGPLLLNQVFEDADGVVSLRNFDSEHPIGSSPITKQLRKEMVWIQELRPF